MAEVTPSETTLFHNPNTRRLRLAPLPLSVLPPHPLLENNTSPDTATKETPTQFFIEVLNEAVSMTDVLMHQGFKLKGKPQTASPSTAPVQLLTYDLLAGESWFGRRSTHEDTATAGTADYQEFENGLFHNHSENEGKYTPDVFDTRKILSYTDGSSGVGLDKEESERNGWTEVDASIFEMGHRIPAPLNKRVFGVLVVRAKVSLSRPPTQAKQDANGFCCAQIPIDLISCKSAFYASGRHKTEGEGERRDKVVLGQYVSVERVRKQRDGKIVWEMATASDAKGWLPMGLQKMGVPGAVIKDVGLFVKWCQSERAGLGRSK